VAHNGKEAVAQVEQQTFDAVLMDVQMPELDGMAATAAIRLRERSTMTHLPIIAMTAHAMKGDRELCLSAGMDDYITKPLKTEELRTALERVGTTATTLLGAEVLPSMPLQEEEQIGLSA
jgi:CheY-like chemotaxis protein